MLVPASASAVGEDQAWFTVYCNVDGASVYFDGEYKGEIINGVLSVPVYTTATPYDYISLEKSGYYTWGESITSYPAQGETVSIYATLNPIPGPTIGGDVGYYTIYCNVDGASVYFDGTYKGETVNGVLSVPVYTTAAPYSTISVEKSGYYTWEESITSYPAQGETVDVYATLNPIPSPTSAPIGGDMGYYTVYCNVDGADVYFDSDYKGQITGGELTVSVYTTGTPYTTYEVQKSGYTSFTSQITDYPTQGETVKLYATLNVAPTSTPTQSSPLSAFTVIGGVIFAGLCLLAVRRM